MVRSDTSLQGTGGSEGTPDSNAVPGSNQAVEWLTWSKAIGLVLKANVGSLASAVLADWCAQGFIETKASLITGGGEIRRNVELMPNLWEFCSNNSLFLNGLDGAVNWSLPADENGKVEHCRIIGPMFRKDQVLDMVSHVDPADVSAVLAPGGGWMEGSPDDASPPVVEQQTKKRAGGRPLAETWPLFVAELALWIYEAEDNPTLTTAPKLIAKLNDRLVEKGLLAEGVAPSTVAAAVAAALHALQEAYRRDDG